MRGNNSEGQALNAIQSTCVGSNESRSIKEHERGKNSEGDTHQQAFPIWTPACPMWMEITSLILIPRKPLFSRPKFNCQSPWPTARSRKSCRLGNVTSPGSAGECADVWGTGSPRRRRRSSRQGAWGAGSQGRKALGIPVFNKPLSSNALQWPVQFRVMFMQKCIFLVWIKF